MAENVSYLVLSPNEEQWLVWVREQHGAQVSRLRRDCVERDAGQGDKPLAESISRSVRGLVEANLAEFIGGHDTPFKGLPLVFADAVWGAFDSLNFGRIAQALLLRADESPAPRFAPGCA